MYDAATSSDDGSMPTEAYAAALAALGAGPARLRRLLAGVGPKQAFCALSEGAHPGDPERRYMAKASSTLLVRTYKALVASSTRVHWLSDPSYPPYLRGDAEAPAVLFSAGDPTSVADRPRVAIVGTRSASPYGLDVATEIARSLGHAGVAVVSGLADGIDSAAHSGASSVESAPQVAVLGKALDCTMSAGQRRLYNAISHGGVVFSELAPGVRGAPAWWFAQRNRVIAAIAHLVIVVECHVKGGALYTVQAARSRAIDVGAVPGSVYSPASEGTNSLIAGGAFVVRRVDDVFAALGRVVGSHQDGRVCREAGLVRQSITPDGAAAIVGGSIEAKVLGLLASDPRDLDSIVQAAHCDLATAALALEKLSDLHLVRSTHGWWSRTSK